MQDNNVEELRSARELWCENGGADLDESLLPKSPEADAPEGTETVPSHTRLQARTGRAFRLCSKAFMLTFNSMVFVQSPELWASFQQWVEERSRAESAVLECHGGRVGTLSARFWFAHLSARLVMAVVCAGYTR